MRQVKGTFLAARPRMIKTRNGETQSYQVAYVPDGDEHDFPAVINVSIDVYGLAQRFARGEPVVLRYIETPPYGDKLVIDLVTADTARVA